jgi:hypothetical protein
MRTPSSLVARSRSRHRRTYRVAETLSLHVLAGGGPGRRKMIIVAECMWFSGVVLAARVLIVGLGLLDEEEGGTRTAVSSVVAAIVLLVGLIAIPLA